MLLGSNDCRYFAMTNIVRFGHIHVSVVYRSIHLNALYNDLAGSCPGIVVFEGQTMYKKDNASAVRKYRCPKRKNVRDQISPLTACKLPC